MRQLLLAILFICAGFSAAQAAATNTAFPPDNCTSDSPFMAFNGQATNQNTYCSNGQVIFNNALLNAANNPGGCSQGQVVTFDGGKFVCKDAPNKPGTCPDGQALTYTTAGFQCMTVPKDYNVSACTAPNFLTYNPSNRSFVCSSPMALNLVCPAGQVLAGISNNQPVCVAQTGGSSTAAADLSCTYHDYGTCGPALSEMYAGVTSGAAAACAAQHSVKQAANGTSNLWFQDIPDNNRTCVAGSWLKLGGTGGNNGDGVSAGQGPGDAATGGPTE